jgi:hypothetical protein
MSIEQHFLKNFCQGKVWNAKATMLSNRPVGRALKECNDLPFSVVSAAKLNQFKNFNPTELMS